MLKAFPASIEVIIRFLSFILLMSSVTAIDLRIHGNSPGKNTGVGSLSLLQQIILTQKPNQGLLHCRWSLYPLASQGGPLWHGTRTALETLKLLAPLAQVLLAPGVPCFPGLVDVRLLIFFSRVFCLYFVEGFFFFLYICS